MARWWWRAGGKDAGPGFDAGILLAVRGRLGPQDPDETEVIRVAAKGGRRAPELAAAHLARRRARGDGQALLGYALLLSGQILLARGEPRRAVAAAAEAVETLRPCAVRDPDVLGAYALALDCLGLARRGAGLADQGHVGQALDLMVGLARNGVPAFTEHHERRVAVEGRTGHATAASPACASEAEAAARSYEAATERLVAGEEEPGVFARPIAAYRALLRSAATVPDRRRAQRGLAEVLWHSGLVRTGRDDLAGALAELRESVALLRHVLDETSSLAAQRDDVVGELGRSIAGLGRALAATGDLDAAVAVLIEGEALTGGPGRQAREAHGELTATHAMLSFTVTQERVGHGVADPGELHELLALTERAVRATRAGLDPGDPGTFAELAEAEARYGMAHLFNGDLDAGLAMLEEALAHADVVPGEEGEDLRRRIRAERDTAGRFAP
ncbi:hypothetical protein [Spongiactinospora sp. TRM90649]|uniref:hypothetical protein n=1 Tax=Spongiactinospora sp. TRM90649 TaxID=3031114 RepID=UPI0023F75640|nr:hypothetical protein [Spongiactinospora sp. TRM90649]MDF5754533.1 hypothetical protein [Spongiactinospora sp. TRM90649]